MQPIPDPEEPEEQTVGALIEYILQQRAVNEKQNQDKKTMANMLAE